MELPTYLNIIHSETLHAAFPTDALDDRPGSEESELKIKVKIKINIKMNIIINLHQQQNHQECRGCHICPKKGKFILVAKTNINININIKINIDTKLTSTTT